ncbi:hypothetical protein RJ640_020420 [Escallonia rubra]|uniref:Fe2OG dioxygenase domain-containing protein n=1 Tax=Escallonia rubra TaxID=112253 RepID=A0AA88UAK3_9ASTE|nr:hypothetical protein RJ640_020420 [Escallonia rubra]
MLPEKMRNLQTCHKLPIIDLSCKNLEKGNGSWTSTCMVVRQALEEYGCFEAFHDKFTPQLHAAIFHALGELFDLPIETKRCYTSNMPLYGYSGESVQAPLRESVNIEEPTAYEKARSFTGLLETVYSYSKQLSNLDQMVQRMVFESFGVEKYYDLHIKSTTNLMRAIKYRHPEKSETNIGIGPHVDATLLTILRQNQVDGLQIQAKDGSWIEVAPSSSSSSFVVLAGVAFKAWSNGRIHSPLHRVIMHGDNARYSLGLFTYSKGLIETPEELVDEQHPLMFEPYHHLESVLLHLSAIYNGRDAKPDM